MKNEYFENDDIDLRILGDIGSVCIYRFPLKTRFQTPTQTKPTTTYINNDVTITKQNHKSYT